MGAYQPLSLMFTILIFHYAMVITLLLRLGGKVISLSNAFIDLNSLKPLPK